MAKTYGALLAEARAEIPTVGLVELLQQLRGDDPPVLVDVREADEVRAGFIPGATFLPRGFLEVHAEARLPDKDARIVTYCAAGIRSLFAAQTLRALGYTRVESADPGFLRWRELGYPVEEPPRFSDAQRERYARHLRVPEIGEVGQARLLRSRVLVLGAGGLGSPAALYLAAAGVGTIGVVDHDQVELSNLQRQILHTTERVGRPKVESARAALLGLNPEVVVHPHEERLSSANVDRLFDAYDVVVDGCDNFPTRYLVSDASLFHKRPIVHGSVSRFEGQVTTFVPFDGPCYRCLFPAPPPPHLAPSCAEAGGLGVLPGLVGVLQATEALKLLLGEGEPLRGRLVVYDALRLTLRGLRYRRDPRCPACGEHPTIRGYEDYEGFCLRGR